MTDPALDLLLRQHQTAWKLTEYHLDGLTTEECLWRPAGRGPHVQLIAGAYKADWPEDESYANGPPSIAWITWHMSFWWSMVLDHSFGDATLEPAAVTWPGSAEAVCENLRELQRRWTSALADLDDAALARSELTRWPYRDRPFGDVMAWVNVELTKNAAEIGYARFLYHSR